MPVKLTRGRALICAGVAAFLASEVYLSGMGRPEEHRYGIGSTQVFESEGGLVAFVAVDLVTYRPGPLQSPRVVRGPIRLYRFDVNADGSFRKQVLASPIGERYLLSFQPILKLPDGPYLLEPPSRGHPSDQLHRILKDRIEPLSAEETRSILGSFGYAGGESRETDPVAERNGWRLLHRSGPSFRPADSVLSRRHQLWLRFAAGESAESIIAESSVEGESRMTTLLAVDPQRWRSSRRPPETPDPTRPIEIEPPRVGRSP